MGKLALLLALLALAVCNASCDQGTGGARGTEPGGEAGYCLFDDGSECEAWAFFRGDCASGESESRAED